jgi:hypothetical protein
LGEKGEMMKITIESTTKIVKANGIDCRVWEGETERGIKVEVLIPRIAVKNGQDVTQFEAELKEQRAPSADAEVFPMRMIL